MSDPVVLLSTGDVVGPAGGVTDNSMVLFSGTSGKLIKGNNAVVTAAGLALLDDVDAAAQRVTLGLGTAATATLTTSPTDGTTGHVTKVGDFGLGKAVGLGAADNIDQYTRSGFYTCDSVAGTLPAGIYSGHLTISGNGLGVAVQCFVPYTAPTRSFIRTWLSSTWTAWQEIAPTDSPAFIGTPTAPTPSIGTRSTAIATMQNFANEFGSSLANNGYQKLPSGLIIQWGSSIGSTAMDVAVTFPIAFPSALYFVSGQIIKNVNNLHAVFTTESETTAGFAFNAVTSGGRNAYPVNWFAIGR